MRKLNEVYFAKEGEYGLTETQAAHLCALANQIKEQHEATLANVSFVNTELSIVGHEGSHVTDAGFTNMSEIEKAIAEISRMNAFIAWFAEARKELEEYRDARTRYDIEGWAKEQGIEMPEIPKSRYHEVIMSTLQDVINEMSIKDRQMYLALEAKSAVYGKFIHPKNPMERARARMHKIAKAPYATEGSGQDTLIYHYEPSVAPEMVDALYNQLQAEYRETEQQLNHMKSLLKRTLDTKNLEENNKKQELIQIYKRENQEYADKMSELTAKYNAWLTEENARIAKFRFVVPEKLSDIEKMLSKLGKK